MEGGITDKKTNFFYTQPKSFHTSINGWKREGGGFLYYDRLYDRTSAALPPDTF